MAEQQQDQPLFKLPDFLAGDRDKDKPQQQVNVPMRADDRPAMGPSQKPAVGPPPDVSNLSSDRKMPAEMQRQHQAAEESNLPKLIPGVAQQKRGLDGPEGAPTKLIPGTQHINPQTGQYEETEYNTAQKMNPMLGLFAHADNISNPALRVMAKIGSGLGTIAQQMNNAVNPEQEKMRMSEVKLPGEEAEQKQKVKLQAAQADQAQAKAGEERTQAATAEKAAKDNMYPVTGPDGSVSYKHADDIPMSDVLHLPEASQMAYYAAKAGSATPGSTEQKTFQSLHDETQKSITDSQRAKLAGEAPKTETIAPGATAYSIPTDGSAPKPLITAPQSKEQILHEQQTQLAIDKENREAKAAKESETYFAAKDGFGNKRGAEGDTKATYQAREKTFRKDYVEPLDTLAKTAKEFNRIDKTQFKTGAEKVTALLMAVGISFDPLKGKGARLNNDILQSHEFSRNIWESGVQKINTVFGSGGPITDQQVSDYKNIAMDVVHDAYVQAATRAKEQGVLVDFLPKSDKKGMVPDKLTMSIYLDSAQGDIDSASRAILAAGYGTGTPPDKGKK